MLVCEDRHECFFLNLNFDMAKLYTKCDEIPLYKFIEAYDGNLKALVISGKASEEELRLTFSRIMDEYNQIIKNKNLQFAVSKRSLIINYYTKISIISAILNFIKLGEIDKIFDLLAIVDIKNVNIETVADAEKLINKIESSLAYIRLRLKMAQEQLDKTSQTNRRVDFTKERMILSSHFKMRIDDKTYTAAEYANLVRLMLNEIEEVKKYGK
nr:MAG TPA: hypothetical protein [Caudoviricetes sp.]